ncbi:OX-2 membrane glycoprotein-like isoform X2 [Echeneis naucrates]|uniref:OX-2 membrane glycoprotein-like isoform X2 n=1 Tax=Echeneis naucrates TaxID=173247 RepID=UPI00111435A0|nr:OX-2 membrane glycoprotein-like isoform X2 [Echeneis naucrates]
MFLLVFTLLVKTVAAQVSGDGNATAEYGGEAYYRCTLENHKDVLQVTWQRRNKDDSLENMATYSKRFGQQVNEPYLGKVIFTEASLNSTSISLRDVSWQDESCYICSFNAFPDGSKRRETCLTVEGISSVNTTVAPKEEDMGVVFSCSATGKPAPTIEWLVSPDAAYLDSPKTMTVKSSDQTFTSSRNITLRLPEGWDGHVDCLLNKGRIGQRQERIHFSLNAAQPEDKTDGKRSTVAIAVVLVAFIVCITVFGVRWRKRLKANAREECV